MEGISHRMVKVNGIDMHIAEKGRGPVVLFLHGFPELWYTWRHQILALSSLGYHAVAPDLRGYGDTEAPASSSSYSCLHIVGDLIALIDYLGVEQVFLVAHDWGAVIGWYLCLFRPDRVKAYLCLSVPYMPRNPEMKPVEGMKLAFGEDYYMCRFQEPGVIEEEISRAGTAEVLKKILTGRRPEADLSFYATKYSQKGFTGGLNFYRALDLNWELTAPWTGAPLKVPVKFVVGELDMVYTTPGIKEFVSSGGFKHHVPLLEEIVVMEGAGHFINQEKSEEISNHIYDYISKY
ncbi:hypothetical protein OIU78_027806 [Salix suchowensis]|nr:hypothetical protein OIU78_027806 [Salix suchowensis]